MVDLVLISVVLAGFIIQTIFTTSLIRSALIAIKEDLANLDESLAQALTQVMENVNLEGVQPPNPLQMMLFELLKGNLEKKPQDLAVIEKGPDGKFTKPS